MNTEQVVNSGESMVIMVGAGRSGSTILSQVLGRHPEVAEWYEAYFIWDYCTGNLDSDVRTEAHATEKCRRFIRREFEIFRRKSHAKFVIDKYPVNSLRIPFIRAIFPKARWIHLIRDGRDVTLSLHEGWERRRKMVEEFRLIDFWSAFSETMSLQPYWRNRLQTVWFELINNFSLNPRRFLNKSKFKGKAGYGPRFEGWEKALDSTTALAFNARQWVESVETVLRDGALIDEGRWLEVRYENLIATPQAELDRIFRFLGLAPLPAATLWKDYDPSRVGRWKSGLTADQLAEISQVIDPTQVRLGYPTCREATAQKVNDPTKFDFAEKEESESRP